MPAPRSQKRLNHHSPPRWGRGVAPHADATPVLRSQAHRVQALHQAKMNVTSRGATPDRTLAPLPTLRQGNHREWRFAPAKTLYSPGCLQLHARIDNNHRPRRWPLYWRGAHPLSHPKVPCSKHLFQSSIALRGSASDVAAQLEDPQRRTRTSKPRWHRRAPSSSASHNRSFTPAPLARDARTDPPTER